MKGVEMSNARVRSGYRSDSAPGDEVEETIRHIKDLVFVRDLLAARGATAAELRRYDAVIDRVRFQLAESAKDASARYAAAA
jgi:hypothetical protein